MVFSPDGKIVASGGHALRLWNVQTGEEVQSFDINVYSLAFSPDGTCIAAGCAGNIVYKNGKDGSYNIRVLTSEFATIPYFHFHDLSLPAYDGSVCLLSGKFSPVHLKDRGTRSTPSST